MHGPRFGILRDPKTIEINEGQIRRHIKPAIGHIRLSDLTRKHIEQTRDDISHGNIAVDVKTKKAGHHRHAVEGKSFWRRLHIGIELLHHC